MTGPQDDPRLPYSVLDPVVGDVFSVLWEPEMIRETGSALKILTSEVLTQIGQTVLSATVMTALMSALQWPISTSMHSQRYAILSDSLNDQQFSRNLATSLTTPGLTLWIARDLQVGFSRTCYCTGSLASDQSPSSGSRSVPESYFTPWLSSRSRRHTE